MGASNLQDKNIYKYSFPITFKMIKRALLCFVVLTLIASVSASTLITIDTLPDYDIYIQVLGEGKSFPALDTIYGPSDLTGYFSDTTDVTGVFDLAVWIKKNNRQIIYEKYESQVAGTAIDLELYPEGYIAPTPTTENTATPDEGLNETENETVIPEVEAIPDEVPETEKTSWLSGHAILGEEGIIKTQYLYYAGGGLMVLVLIGFLAMFLKGRASMPKEIKIKKLSELHQESEDNNQKTKEVEEAEAALKKAQMRLNELKNSDKVAELKKKIIEDQQALMRLREGKE